jgi:Planctomycete cytochrome C
MCTRKQIENGFKGMGLNCSCKVSQVRKESNVPGELPPKKKALALFLRGISCVTLLLQNNPNAGAQGKANTASPSAVAALVRFEDGLLPVLQANCTKCHSGSSPQAGLDVRTRTGLLKGGLSGAAIVPGEAEKSLMYQRVRNGQMPLGGLPLTEAEVERVRLD